MIEIFGIESILKFRFVSKNHNFYKALITDLMLKKKFLANTTIYISVYHTNFILNKYFRELDKIFGLISKIEKGIVSTNKIKLSLPISDFKRFN